MIEEICNLGVLDLARLYRKGEISPVEVVDAHLQRCEKLNPVLNAFLLILRDSALQASRAMEALFQARIDLGPLQGVPISIKDIIRLQGTVTTAASRVLLGEPPDQRDAAVVQSLKTAGAIIIGKTNLHEFATGDPDPNGPFGLVQNPRRIGYLPGSSSSGAGAAAAAGLGVIAIGSDTGGSVRLPAYLCGVVGLKPTNGKVDMEGIIPLSFTLDTVGPLARRVSDVAAVLATWTGGRKERDRIGGPERNEILDNLDQSVRGWRIGVPMGEFFHQSHPPVASAFKNTLQLLGNLGCQLVDFDPPGIEEMEGLQNLIIQAEGSAYHERYRDREDLYGANIRERVFPGRELKALKYLVARNRQIELQREWLIMGKQFNLLVTPAGPTVAPQHGVKTIEIGGQQMPFRPVLRRYTFPFNLLGWPALSIPNGITAEGLPTGLQIAGPPDSEERLLILGYQLEKALGLVDELGIEPRPSAAD